MGISGTIQKNNITGTISNQSIGGILNCNQISGKVIINSKSGSLIKKDFTGTISINTIVIQQYCTESIALFARMPFQPNNALKQLIDKTIRDYKECGYWDKCDVLVKFNLFDEQAGLLNLKGNYCNPINVNGCVFTPYIGYQGDGISKVINTKYTRTRTGNVFKQNDAHFYKNVYALSTAPASSPVGDGGGNGIGGLTSFGNSPTTYVNYGRMNGSSITTGQINGAVGHAFLGRNNTTQIHHKVNNNTSTLSQNSYPLSSEEQYIFGLIWGSPTSSVTYKHNARYYGYSFGSYIDDTLADRVIEINDYFNNNISSTF